MPKNCRECNFCSEISFEGYLWFDFYCRAKDKEFDLNENEDKPNWCPLINIPAPHGRLIDADKFEFEMNDKLLIALTEKYGEKEAQSGLHFSFRDCICNIQCQPTVIEAEGRQHHDSQ